MQDNPMDWRAILETIEMRTRPEAIARDLAGMIELAEDDEELGIAALGGFSGEFLIISAGMAAMYVMPPEDPTTALEMVVQRLAALDFETGMDQLGPEEQRLVRRYVALVKPLFTDLGRVMAAIFGAYARGEYDLEQEPNALIQKAQSHMPMEPQAALQILGRAGALGLRGKSWWWRWSQETLPPLGHWIALADNLIQVVLLENDGPLDGLDVLRERWQSVTRQAAQELSNLEESSGAELDAEWDDEEEEDEELDSLLEELFQGADALSSDLLAQLAARREDVIPHLIDIAQDQELWAEDAEGDGWAPIHAVDALSKLRAAEAVNPLIDILAQTEPNDILHDRAGTALKEIGTPAGRAVLETIRYTRNLHLKQTLASILGTVGRDEPEAFDTLARLYDELSWDELRLFVVWGLTELGDPRAIPILERAWRDPKLPEIDIGDVAESLRRFGVEPYPPRKPGPRFNPLPMRSHSIKLGRNDPCWCGSGKKYKYCHLTQDERGQRQ